MPLSRPIGTRARRAVAVLTLVAVSALAGMAGIGSSAAARPAVPADCGLNAFNDLLTQPDAMVLVGVVRSRGNQVGDSAQDGFRYDVAVRQQIPEDADPTLVRSVTVTQVREGAEPVARLKQGDEYFFAAQGSRDTFVATGCASVLPYDESLEREIERTIASASEGPTGEPETIRFVLDDAPGDSTESSFGRALAPGLAISLLGVLGVIAFAIAGRRTG